MPESGSTDDIIGALALASACLCSDLFYSLVLSIQQMRRPLVAQAVLSKEGRSSLVTGQWGKRSEWSWQPHQDHKTCRPGRSPDEMRPLGAEGQEKPTTGSVL